MTAHKGEQLPKERVTKETREGKRVLRFDPVAITMMNRWAEDHSEWNLKQVARMEKKRNLDRFKDIESKYLNLLAIFAVRRLLGLKMIFPDWNVYRRKPNCSFSYRGVHFFVQWCTLRPGYLLESSKGDFRDLRPSDIMILIGPSTGLGGRQQFKYGIFHGWTTYKNFRQQATGKDFGYGTRLALPESRLATFPALKRAFLKLKETKHEHDN